MYLYIVQYIYYDVNNLLIFNLIDYTEINKNKKLLNILIKDK